MKKEFQIWKPPPEIPLDPPFSKGEIRYLPSQSIKKALLPLEKGGREGFLGKPPQMVNQLPK
jgi:hypothetical protein